MRKKKILHLIEPCEEQKREVKASVHLTSNKAYVQYRFIGGGWLPILLGILMLGAIYVPYFIVLIRGTLYPILPFVSQAAGSPPQSGIFSVLLSLSALVSFIGMHLLHMVIRLHNERLQIKTSRQVVDLLNKAILIPGHIAILGMFATAGYPLDFHRHNEDWMMVTIVPHLMGAGSLFIGGIFYCILFTYIMSVIHPEKEELRSTRLTLIAVVVFCGALHAATAYTAFMPEFRDVRRLTSCETIPIKYNTHYIICSVCEWVMLTAFVFFFMTIREEAKCVSFTMTVTLDDSQTATEKQARKPVLNAEPIQMPKQEKAQEAYGNEQTVTSNGHM